MVIWCISWKDLRTFGLVKVFLSIGFMHNTKYPIIHHLRANPWSKVLVLCLVCKTNIPHVGRKSCAHHTSGGFIPCIKMIINQYKSKRNCDNRNHSPKPYCIGPASDLLSLRKCFPWKRKQN